MTSELTPSPEKPRCAATTRAGHPCGALAVSGTPFCNVHGPKGLEMSIKGGRHRATAYRLEKGMSPRLRDVVTMLQDAARDVRSGDIKPSQGQALAAIASALLRALEQADLEIRVMALEVRTTRGGHDEPSFRE